MSKPINSVYWCVFDLKFVAASPEFHAAKSKVEDLVSFIKKDLEFILG